MPPVWTNEDPEEYRMHREELAAQDARCNAYAAYVAARKEEDEDEPEPAYGWHYQCRMKNSEQVDGDPLHALGRIVKVAGKTLWKRVSNKDVAAAAAAASTTSMSKQPRVDFIEHDSKIGSPTSPKACPPSTLPPIPGSPTSNLTSNVDDHHTEEGGVVWEEEIENTFPLNISQTETIIEGRAVYSRTTSKVEVMSRSLPPLPSMLNSKKVLTKRPSTKKIPPFKVKHGS